MEEINKINLAEIRKNWNIHKNTIPIDSQLYNDLWNDLYIKFDLEKLDSDLRLYGLFRNFIDNKPIYKDNTFVRENNKTLIIKGMDGSDRKSIHILCDKIGLHHNSVTVHYNVKNLYIYLPDNWCFEYTTKNPYSDNYNYYEGKRHNRLSNLICDNCGCNGHESTIYNSVYIKNRYCENCLDIVSDGGGGTLSNHKFEPMN